MDLRQLRQFVTLAEELHFGHAAARLHMTQPPLSQAIRKLEADLGTRLFERTQRSVELTPVGRAWLPHVRRVLEEAAALPGTAQRLAAGELGALRLAFVTTADYSVLPGLVSRYRGAFPDVTLTLREATSDLQIDALLHDDIDAGMVIGCDDVTLHESLAYRPLLRETLVVAVPEAWVLERRRGFTGAAVRTRVLGETPLILFPRHVAPAFHDVITGYLSEHGLRPAVYQEAIQMQTIIGLVAAGLGVALVPQSLTRMRREGARYLALAEPPPQIETGLLWRAADLAPPLQRLLAMIAAPETSHAGSETGTMA